MWRSVWADPSEFSLLSTFFQIRERNNVETGSQNELRLPSSALDSSNAGATGGLTALPPQAQDALAQAATARFHDVIGLLVVLAAAPFADSACAAASCSATTKIGWRAEPEA